MTATQSEKPRKKVGLALGSGGVRGLAHVGVLKVLIANNIPIDMIAGTSIGAWVAAFYALTQDLEKLEDATVGHRRNKFFALAEPSFGGGLIKGKKFENFLHQWFGDAQFSDLAVPTTVVACDIFSGEEVDIADGPIVPAVRASMSIPLMFRPMQYRGQTLIDGALVNPLPDNIVRAMGADIVISVDLDFSLKTSPHKESLTLKTTALRSYSIMRHYLARYSAISSDVTITPVIDIWGYRAWKQYFTDATISYLVTAGEEAAKQQLPAIQKLLS